MRVMTTSFGYAVNQMSEAPVYRLMTQMLTTLNRNEVERLLSRGKVVKVSQSKAVHHRDVAIHLATQMTL